VEADGSGGYGTEHDLTERTVWADLKTEVVWGIDYISLAKINDRWKNHDRPMEAHDRRDGDV